MPSEIFEVEKLLDIKCEQSKVYVYVKWEDYSEEENTWEPIQNLGKWCAVKLLNELKLKIDNPRKIAMIDASINHLNKNSQKR